MALKYLAGNRIQGTDAERLATLGFIEDGSNTVLKFTKVGGTNTFTPSGSFNVEYLVVAGGGGSSAGAGGAGGYRTATGFGVTAQAYSITVGAGGAKSSASGTLSSTQCDLS